MRLRDRRGGSLLVTSALCLLPFALILSASAQPAAKVSYARQVKPLLEQHCAMCHSADAHTSGFSVANVASLEKGGRKAGPAVIPGKPDQSPLVQYVRGVRQPQMPKGLPPLSADELHLIRMWIQGGAVDDSSTVAAVAKRPSAPLLSNTGIDPALQQQLMQTLFSGNPRDLMILRRNLRVAQLPLPPAPPAVQQRNLVFNPIDQFVVKKWETDGYAAARQPPAVCDDIVYLRRVYLDLTGVIPTVDEARRFLADRSPDKRTRLVDELLARKSDYAAHWTPFWEDAIASASNNITGGIATHGNYRKWIYKNLYDNTPYDVMVATLIDPTMPGYQKPVIGDANGKILRVNYILNQTHTETIQSAANVAQVFLGTGMKCASCHNHFLNPEWPQTRFMAFASFFSPKDMEVIRCEQRSGKYVPPKFPFDIPGAPAAVPQDLDGRLHLVAQLLTDPVDPRFSKTIVNRLWKRYFGLGIYEPADDFRADRKASNPELLTWLAYDFMKHGYDLKHTIRLILTSRTYQLQYDPKFEDHFNIAKPDEPRYFASPALRRLTAEELLDSMTLATTQRLDPKARVYLDKTSTALTRALGKPASRNEVSTARPDDVAVVQSLELLNGQEYHDMIYTGDILDKLAGKPPEKVVDSLYWAALNRPPTPQERALGVSFLKRDLNAPQQPTPGKAETIWVDDDAPPGSTFGGSGGAKSWRWVAKPQFPVFSGERAHALDPEGSSGQHFVVDRENALRVSSTDALFAYAYLDPAHPPKRIWMRWQQEGHKDWAYQACWGEMCESTADYVGTLPKPGEWVRLEVPLQKLGTRTGAAFTGWAFGQSDGVVYWDKAGVLQIPENPAVEPLGDMLWALLTSPEFQYIR